MPIRVTCSKCMARFNVSEKFAGREGPCPKCKTVIRIPEKSEEIVIHAPEDAGPKDSKGRQILKPIRRRETVLTPVQIALIAVCIIGFLIVALLLPKFFGDNPANIPVWVMPALLVALAPACVLGAYTFLRNQETGAFAGRELLYRVLVCAAIYAVTWAAMPLAKFAFNDTWGPGAWFSASLVMLVAGSAVATLVLELDWIMGAVHYGLYFGCSLLLRVCAQLPLFPSSMGPDGTPSGQPAVPVPDDQGLGNIIGWIDWQQTAECFLAWLR